MNKKNIFISSFFLIVSLSAGIFVETIMATDKLTVSAASLSVGECLFQYMKSDLLTMLACVIFSCSVVLLPCVFITISIKVFSIGFSAVCILLSGKGNNLVTLLLTLLPRAVFKLPAYLGLLIISTEISIFIYNCFKGNAEITELITHLKKYLICFLLLIVSSVIEVFLLQGVL